MVLKGGRTVFLDFCPAFWEWLIAGNQAKRVFNIEKICDEIAAGDDELSEWAAERGDGMRTWAILAMLFACLAVTGARADGLKLPEPAPVEPPAEQYFVVSAELLAQVQALLEAQRREIERLRAAKFTERCI